MASELHDKSYDAAAAVIAGSVLEQHLKKLAAKEGVPIAKSVEQLGVDLRKHGAFSETERKMLQSWYAQRTDGAHGRLQNIVPEEVGRMIPGIREFMARHPA